MNEKGMKEKGMKEKGRKEKGMKEKILRKELSRCHNLWSHISHNGATRCRRPLVSNNEFC